MSHKQIERDGKSCRIATAEANLREPKRVGSPIKRVLAASLVALCLCVQGASVAAQPACFKDFKQYVEGSYKYFEYNNTCGADIVMNYVLQSEHGTSTGSFMATHCRAGRAQYFDGRYTFEFEV